MVYTIEKTRQHLVTINKKKLVPIILYHKRIQLHKRIKLELV